jgi:hypothetical protein
MTLLPPFDDEPEIDDPDDDALDAREYFADGDPDSLDSLRRDYPRIARAEQERLFGD